jgi:hypothetical protein
MFGIVNSWENRRIGEEVEGVGRQLRKDEGGD